MIVALLSKSSNRDHNHSRVKIVVGEGQVTCPIAVAVHSAVAVCVFLEPGADKTSVDVVGDLSSERFDCAWAQRDELFLDLWRVVAEPVGCMNLPGFRHVTRRHEEPVENEIQVDDVVVQVAANVLKILPLQLGNLDRYITAWWRAT